MAFKDKFDKLISYFDTDEVSDVEETVEDEVRQPRVQQQVELSHSKHLDVQNSNSHQHVLNKLKLLEGLFVNVCNLNKDVQLMKIRTFIH